MSNAAAQILLVMRAAAAEEILIVDDDADNRLGYVALLLDAGYRVREAPDGVSCLTAVAAQPPAHAQATKGLILMAKVTLEH